MLFSEKISCRCWAALGTRAGFCLGANFGIPCDSNLQSFRRMSLKKVCEFQIDQIMTPSWTSVSVRTRWSLSRRTSLQIYPCRHRLSRQMPCRKARGFSAVIAGWIVQSFTSKAQDFASVWCGYSACSGWAESLSETTSSIHLLLNPRQRSRFWTPGSLSSANLSL